MVTNSIKTLKMVHVKIILKKKKQLYRVLMSIKEARPMCMPNLTCGI